MQTQLYALLYTAASDSKHCDASIWKQASLFNSAKITLEIVANKKIQNNPNLYVLGKEIKQFAAFSLEQHFGLTALPPSCIYHISFW